MSTATDTGQEAPAEDSGGTSRSSRRTGGRGLGRENLALLLTLPLLVGLLVGGWALWRANADLDAIEARQLDWSAIWQLTWEHVKLTAAGAAVTLLTAIPMGIALTRPKLRRAAGPVVAFANMGQAAPVIGLIVLLAIWLGFSFSTAVLALTIYGFLPVLRNTIVGLQSVDPTLVEASRGMGLSNFATLVRVELPMALPIIMAGVRTALVLLAGAASFGTFINAGGLGALITTGVTLFRYSILVSGAVLIAALALLVDWVGRVLEVALTPKGI